MLTLRPAADRGHARFDWLDSRHTFSFGHYYDPKHMGFGPLRVINQDVVAPGKGFARHGHSNMEIVSYVIAGALEHRDSLGTGSVIRPGDVQAMRAGTGIEHSEFNGSATEPVHFLQIWIQPDRLGLAPGYQQLAFPHAERRNQLKLLASGYGEPGVIGIRQAMRLYGGLLDAGGTLDQPLDVGRGYWLQLVHGRLSANGQALAAGDGAALLREDALSLRATEDAEFLLFDLPA